MGALLDGCRHRLKFVRDELEYQSTNESALEHLRRAHAALLPASVRGDTVPEGPSAEPVPDQTRA